MAILSGVLAFAQSPITNAGFEQGEVGEVPMGWLAPKVTTDAGFSVKLVDSGCRSGKCVMMTGTPSAPEGMFGNVMQNVRAAGYIMRRVRLRSAIRVEGENTRAQMWLRLDRADHSMAFLENMGNRPIRSAEWNTYDIETEVPADAANIAIGVILFGPGKAWVDDFSLEIVGEILKDKVEPPRPLTAQGLTNLTAFARFYGYVRHFHPSDQAARTDWEGFAINGVREVEGAESNTELIARLDKMFHPIAPTVLVFGPGKRPPPAPVSPAANIVRYVQSGVGLPTSTTGTFNIYQTERPKKPAEGQEMPKPFEADLVPGVRASIPLALYADDKGTLPHAPLPLVPPLYNRSGDDRATRLADVIIAWNVFQHFYPYFDVVKTDWPAELPKGLKAAATDAGAAEFQKTLQHLVAALKDGHGRVGGPKVRSALNPPVTLDWVEGQFIVTRVQTGKAEGIAPGDRVLKIDGVPIEKAAADARALISGATDQWIRYRSAGDLSSCNADTKKMTLELEPFQPGASKTFELDCAPPKYKDAEWYTEPRPAKITELEPGIMYVDLDRVTESDFTAAIPQLEKAQGVIFDMRGYPGQPGITSLAHLTDSEIRSAKWNVGSAAMPDRLETVYKESGWPVQPKKPYFSARRVFLIDGRAISYAETVMGIVEAFKLGEIVGGPTAGTNGNVNPFKLPGGYNISWTGMKVLKHDGSQHHGIGILPTVPASRTRKGVAEGKDEILAKGLEVVKNASK
jgi:C-terminal processing protease CtpA/Prc